MLSANANLLAFAALALFPLIAFLVFPLFRPTVAAIVLFLAGDMLLPSRIEIDLPGLPGLDKNAITCVSILLCLLIRQPRRMLAARPGRRLEWLAIAMAVGELATVLANGAPIQHGPVTIPGISPTEWPTSAAVVLLTFGTPFLLGRLLLRDVRDLTQTLSIIAIAAVLYTPLMAIELVLSPQLHHWVYGYHPEPFVFSVRYGGFRPSVFMVSGLAVAMFLVVAVVGAAGLARARSRILQAPALLVTVYLAAFLVLTKSVAAIFWGLPLAGAVLLVRARWLAALAVALSILVITFPALRMADLFPWESLVANAEVYDETRASSLRGRFENENAMLENVRERPWLGWGGYGRHWVYDEATGESRTVPDGFWIIQLGSRGIVGFVTAFGLYVIPVFAAGWRLRRVQGRKEQLLLAALMLIVAIRALDQLPNGLWTSFPIFLAGGLDNLARTLTRAQPRRHAPPARTPTAHRERSLPGLAGRHPLE